MDIKKYYFDDPYLFKYCLDQLIRSCVSNDDQIEVLTLCHSKACGGHFSARKTADKIPQADFYWPTLFKDCIDFCKTCAWCQQLGEITKRNMMPLTPILIIEIFDCWGLDFMGPPSPPPPPHVGTFTFYWKLIMFLSGWRPFQRELMTTRLF